MLPQRAHIEIEKCSTDDNIKTTDSEIDNLVYELYGLTEEEIRIVEKGVTN